jgi:hypothetical protein
MLLDGGTPSPGSALALPPSPTRGRVAERLPCKTLASSHPAIANEGWEQISGHVLPSPLWGGVGGGASVIMFHLIEYEFDYAN